MSRALLELVSRPASHWPEIHWGNVERLGRARAYVIRVQVYLGEIPAEAVRVQVYAERLERVTARMPRHADATTP